MIQLFFLVVVFVYKHKISKTNIRLPYMSKQDSNTLNFFKNAIKFESTYLRHTRSIELTCELLFAAFKTRTVTNIVDNCEQPTQFVECPCIVTRILCEHKMDSSTIITALLHYTLVETSLEMQDIKNLYTKQISNLLLSQSKVCELFEFVQGNANIQSILLSWSFDSRVIVIKMAYHIYTMRNIQSFPIYHQSKLANQTLDVFVPIAHQLGLWSFKNELEYLAFNFTNPNACKYILNYISIAIPHKEIILKYIEAKLTNEILKHFNVDVDISYRIKSVKSIHDKCITRNMTIDEVDDILAVRVVTNEKLCYPILRILINTWNTIYVRDYIKFPKKNGYQSLHCTIELLNKRVEIQIRSHSMHAVAEHGTASHWIYKKKTLEMLSI